MRHAQALLMRLLSMRGRKISYELERANQRANQEREVQARRRNMEGIRMEATKYRVRGNDG